MNDDIREAMNLRDDTRKNLKSDRYTITLQEQYKYETKRVKTLIKEGKAEHYRNEFLNNKDNTSKAWKTIRKIFPNCKSNTNGCNFDNEMDKDNEFNVHFSNVGKNTYEKTQEILHVENVTCFSDENVILVMVAVLDLIL